MAIKFVKDEKLWVEQDAIDQVSKIAQYPGMINACGLPDLHSGVIPVGVTFETKGVIYPSLIGNDIGCGMSLFNTNIKLKKFDLAKWYKKLENTKMDGIYSIGGGNHFAEICEIETINHHEYAKQLGLDKKNIYILVHSGSRNMGAKIYQRYQDVPYLEVNDERFNKYLLEHDEACCFAKENRYQVACQLLDFICIKYDNQLIVDCIHNGIVIKDDHYFHHKGSINTDCQYAIIAGTRGSYSYIVKCHESKDTLYSISHGAGRKWPRNLCKGRLENKYQKDELTTTKLGSKVLCSQKELYYEEAKEAYKNIEDIIRILKDHQAIEVIATLKPKLTYKC